MNGSAAGIGVRANSDESKADAMERSGDPLWHPTDLARPIAFRSGRPVTLGEFVRHVAAAGAHLPSGRSMVDLCEDRYHFLVAYAAALRARHCVLLPSSRAEQVVGEVAAANPGSYVCDDAMIAKALRDVREEAPGNADVEIAADTTAMIAFTSGSTGQPKAFPKLWSSVTASTTRNAASIRRESGLGDHEAAWILATVPPQHM